MMWATVLIGSEMRCRQVIDFGNATRRRFINLFALRLLLAQNPIHRCAVLLDKESREHQLAPRVTRGI